MSTSAIVASTAENATGILLVGHGTRDQGGLAEFSALVGMVADAVEPMPVEAGFIELAEPTIGGAFNRLAEQGVKQVRVIPLLLFAAGHAKSDVPLALRRAANLHPHIATQIVEPFGMDEHILALSKHAYVEGIAGRDALEPHQTYLLFVGRGSSDAEATAGLARLAEVQAQRLGILQFGHCFVAAARPALAEGIERAVHSVATGVKRIVVQPHLLFRGAVLDEIRTAVARNQAQHSTIEWVLASHLGPEQEVVDAVVERARRQW